MIEVQIRRPCSDHKPVRYPVSIDGFLTTRVACSNCPGDGYVYEWIPLERAVQMAHEEAVRMPASDAGEGR